MSVRIKAECPMCSFSHFVKADDDMNVDFSGVDDVDCPTIFFVSVTSGGDKKIQNHSEPIYKYHGGNGASEKIERDILEHMRRRAEEISAILEQRLAEL